MKLKSKVTGIHFVFTVLLASSLPVLGEHTLDCANASNTFAINECIELDFKKADKKLNTNYKELMKTFKTTKDSDQKKMAALIKS